MYISSMPAKAIALSPSVGELLRNRRRRLGYTLRQVEQLTSAQGNLIPFSTLARIEQGRLDPGLKRLHALLQLYGLPIQAAGDLLEMESLAGTVEADGDFATLRDRGTEAWRSGDLPTALGCYLALRRRADDQAAGRSVRHEAILSFAVMAGKLGKHHIARQILDDLFLDKPDRPTLLRTFVFAASTWHALGSTDVALAHLFGAEQLVEPGDRQGRGWILHMRGSIQVDFGTFDEARANLVEAARLYEKARRPYDRALALVTLARLEVERGDATEAVRAARRAANFAALRSYERVRALAVIQEARAYLLDGKPDRALTVLTQVLAATIAASDNVIRFYSHFYLSKAYASLGDSLRSQVEFDQARYFVRFVENASKETSEVRGHLKDGSTASSI
jgi:transcriptional regulator with XRE-family HTH domain